MARPPLEGLRILAVSQFGAGPFGTQPLAGLGPTSSRSVPAIVRNVRLLRIGAGSGEIMTFLIAREVL